MAEGPFARAGCRAEGLPASVRTLHEIRLPEFAGGTNPGILIIGSGCKAMWPRLLPGNHQERWVVDKTPPLLGFNNNVRHHGRIFHIQTEDSGVKHARIVTHLFADGGRIVNSTRTDYAEHLGRPDMTEVLRRIMREQHKAMFIRLRAGELDPLIEAACGPLPREGEVGGGSARTPGPVAPSPAASPHAALPAPAAEPPPANLPSLASEPPAVPEAAPKRRRLSNPNLQPGVRSVTPPAGEIELDQEMLEGSGSQLARPGSPAAAEPEPDPPPEKPVEDPEKPPEDEARYAPPRPPNIFEAPLTEHSIFGEQLIREKSLDEVILSYLSEDLEGGSHEPD